METAEIQGGFKAFKVGDQNSRCFQGFQGFQGSVDTLSIKLSIEKFPILVIPIIKIYAMEIYKAMRCVKDS